MAGAAGRPDLKLRRAELHADALRIAILEYRQSGSFYVEQKENAKLRTLDLTLRVNAPPPLEEWSLIFGDCIHNLRSALDHLAWQLDPKPDRETEFPIFLEPPHRWPPSCVARMKSGAQTIIDGVQPHWETMHSREPQIHPLAAIHGLDIDDKHKIVIRTAEALGGDSIIGMPPEATIEHLIPALFADGELMARVHFRSSQVIPLVCDAHFQVVLTDPPWSHADVMWMLDEVFPWVKRVVVEPLIPYARA
jgi:hypothetical protein